MDDEVTDLLQRWKQGEEAALSDLVPVIYADLRRLARRALRRERSDHTLQPTALVHEAFLRLVPQQEKDWRNREQFFAVCAGLMRQVLVDHARRRLARKRGDPKERIVLDEADLPAPNALPLDVLELDRALTDLADLDPSLYRLVELRYFGGMSLAEIGVVLGRSEWDLKKDWKLAKAWLARRLEETPPA